MSSSYFDALMEPEKKPSQRELLLRLLAQLFALMGDDTPEGVAPKKDGTEPEIYVAPRYSPSP